MYENIEKYKYIEIDDTFELLVSINIYIKINIISNFIFSLPCELKNCSEVTDIKNMEREANNFIENEYLNIVEKCNRLITHGGFSNEMRRFGITKYVVENFVYQFIEVSLKVNPGLRKALSMINDDQLISFFRIVGKENHNTTSIRLINEMLDRKQTLQSIFYSTNPHGYTISVERKEDSIFEIDFGYKGHLVGDGGRWKVTFGDQNQVASFEKKHKWIC